MILSQMITLVNSYVDDVLSNDDIIRWLNMGKDRMATEVKCTFPDLPTVAQDQTLSSSFIFPSKYHEVPCLYASAMYRGQESSLNEKGSFMQQFELGVRNFSENYNPPVQYLDQPNVIQYTATAGQTDFVVANDMFTPFYGGSRFYVNSLPSDNFSIQSKVLFKYVGVTPLVLNDKVTLIFEQNANFIEPPYAWMRSW